MIGIIDYGSGNISAISNIYKSLKISHVVSSDTNILSDCDRFVLPGVGAFDATMKRLKDSGLQLLLEKQVRSLNKPILGICVGMQILAESSEEGALPGLGWIQGSVKKIDASCIKTKLKLPHMGWNSVAFKPDEILFKNVNLEDGFYFLHNYFFSVSDSSDVISSVTYGADMPCAVRNKNVMGVQFHPEKSHRNGVEIFRNFSEL